MNAVPSQYWIRQDAGARTPPLSSKKYRSEALTRTGLAQSSWTHCSPSLGQVPQRRFTPSLETGGSLPPLFAVALSPREGEGGHRGAPVDTVVNVGGGGGGGAHRR